MPDYHPAYRGKFIPGGSGGSFPRNSTAGRGRRRFDDDEPTSAKRVRGRRKLEKSGYQRKDQQVRPHMSFHVSGFARPPPCSVYLGQEGLRGDGSSGGRHVGRLAGWPVRVAGRNVHGIRVPWHPGPDEELEGAV